MTVADPITERRLMASIIVEPGVLAAADDVEDQDFSDPRLRHVLAAVRRLRACGADIGIDEIDHEIQLADMEREQRSAGSVRDKCGFWFLVEIVVECFRPYGADALLHHDMWWLRELAERRRNLRNAA